jgi:hypothetical protein
MCITFGEIEHDIMRILEPGFARFRFCRRGWRRVSCCIEQQRGANRRDSGGMQAKRHGGMQTKRRYGASYIGHWKRFETEAARNVLRSLTLARRIAKIQVAAAARLRLTKSSGAHFL